MTIDHGGFNWALLAFWVAYIALAALAAFGIWDVLK
jgi:hypothetical protein